MLRSALVAITMLPLALACGDEGPGDGSSNGTNNDNGSVASAIRRFCTESCEVSRTCGAPLPDGSVSSCVDSCEDDFPLPAAFRDAAACRSAFDALTACVQTNQCNAPDLCEPDLALLEFACAPATGNGGGESFDVTLGASGVVLREITTPAELVVQNQAGSRIRIQTFEDVDTETCPNIDLTYQILDGDGEQLLEEVDDDVLGFCEDHVFEPAPSRFRVSIADYQGGSVVFDVRLTPVE